MKSNFILTTPEDLKELIANVVRSEMSGFKPVPTESKEGQEFLTRKQTAEKLQVSLVTLHDWTKKGVIQGYRISRRIRYKATEVEAALKEMIS